MDDSLTAITKSRIAVTIFDTVTELVDDVVDDDDENDEIERRRVELFRLRELELELELLRLNRLKQLLLLKNKF